MKKYLLKPIAAILAVSLISACAAPSANLRNEARNAANPAVAPQRTVTGFTDALRCMDDMMFDYGVRDVTLMMEELQDSTKKLGVGTRDMMVAAISDMTRRSRAVRLSVFGIDNQNLATLLQTAQRLNNFQIVPEFDIRGSISQLDEDVQRRSSSFGAIVESLFGVKFSRDIQFSVLGFDSAVARTEDFTLVPGVNSKNTVVIAKQDAGAGDGTGRIRKANLTFSFSVSQQEGLSQSLRNMVDLASVELVGKLTRLPYWQCLKIPESSPEVAREMADWFVSMGDDELVRFVQERLRDRRFYDGAIDGQRNENLDLAIAAFRAQSNLPASAAIDEPLFRSVLTTQFVRGTLAALSRTKPAAKPGPAGLAGAGNTFVETISGVPAGNSFVQTISVGPAVNSFVPTSSAATAGSSVVQTIATPATTDAAIRAVPDSPRNEQLGNAGGQSDRAGTRVAGSIPLPASLQGVPSQVVASQSAPTQTAPSQVAPSQAVPPQAGNPQTNGRPPLTMLARSSTVSAGADAGFTVLAGSAGYVYCYTADPRTDRIQRVFPNRYMRDPRIAIGQAISLPDDTRVRFPVSSGQQRKFACMLAPRELYADLPAALRWGDFEDIKVSSFDEVRNRFAAVSGTPIPMATLTVAAK